MPGISVNDNGTIKAVTALHVNDGGTVKLVQAAYVNEGGTVKQFWPTSGVPGVPPNLRTTATAANTVDLAWDAANPNGFAITGYDVWMATSQGGAYAFKQSFGNVLTGQITGLAASTTYWFKVLAKNSAGSGQFSNEVQAQTVTAAFPQPPSIVATGTTSSNAIELQITVGSGGLPTQYQIATVGKNGSAYVEGAPFAYTGSPQIAYAGGLASAETFQLQVRAINGAGTSGWSNVTFQTTDGTLVNSGSLNCGTDANEPPPAAFPDIGYGYDSPAAGGSGYTFGSASPTQVSGYTVSRLARTGSLVFAIELVGASIPGNFFSRLTVGDGSTYTLNLNSANAAFTPGLGPQGNLNRWQWSGLPANDVASIIDGAALLWNLS